MKKAALWIAVLAAAVHTIAMLAMGIGVYRIDEELIRITAYIALPCLVLFATLVLRFSASKCPHCGRRIPEDAAYCPYCGKEIK